MTSIVQSGDASKVFNAFVVGNGALAMNMDVNLFFTAWSIQYLLKEDAEIKCPKSYSSIQDEWMKELLKNSNFASIETLLKEFKNLGGKIFVCDTVLELLDIKKSDFLDGIVDKYVSVVVYIKEAGESKINLFI
jgi:peroxiredoxin family protein